VEMIIEGNALERNRLDAGVPQRSPVSQILFAIYTAGMIKWVEEYISEAEGQSFVDVLGWVATASDVSHTVSILERCAERSIEWDSRQGLQFDNAKTEAALFTRRRGHRKHLWPQRTAKIRVGSGVIQFNTQATRWLGIWMDAHIMFKEPHNRYMKKARAPEARLGTPTTTYAVVPQSIRAVSVACVQAVALYGSELSRDPKEAGRRDDIQLLLNRQPRFILGELPKTPRGAHMRELGLTPVPVILDSRQQKFGAKLADACSSKLKELH